MALHHYLYLCRPHTFAIAIANPAGSDGVSVAIALTFLLSVGTLVSPTQFSRCATPDTARAVGNYPSNGCPWWVPAILRSPLKESQVGLPLRGGLNYAFILYTYTAANVHCRICGCMHPSQRLRFHVDRKAGVGDS